MAGYVKMFQSILDSTIWKQPATITKVWMTMMAMADRDGVVTAAIPGLADRAHVTVAIVEKALSLFLAPDPYSKTPDNEGRRIEIVHGVGWRLLTYEKHREMLSMEDQRTKNADRQQRWRDRHRNAGITLRNTECDNTDSGSSLPLGSSGSPPGDPAGARSNESAKTGPWDAADWQRQFNLAWSAAYNTVALPWGGTSAARATSDLGDMLASLGGDAAIATQARAPVMFAEFLATPDPKNAKHPWAWFVTAFPGLRAPARQVTQNVKVGHARAPAPGGRVAGDVKL